MRSELINEIFSVEVEAEKIVAEAQQKGRLLVSKKQSEGEAALRLAVEKARSGREDAIKAAQAASTEKIQTYKTSLELSDSDKRDMHACAEQIAEELVEMLCQTQLREISL